MEKSTQTIKLLLALKQQLKDRGLRYRSVAASLGVSEATVKRYFSGRGITIDVLQNLAEVVELDLFSLVIIAQDQSVDHRGLNKAQQAVFNRRGPLSATLFLLYAGWTPAQIVREFDLAPQIDSILARLEALGMIRRLSKGGVKILIRPELGAKAYGQMSEQAAVAAHQFLREINVRNDNCEWMLGAARLSNRSILDLRQLISRFDNEVRELSRRDRSLPREDTQWFRLFVGAQSVSRKGLLGRV